MALWIQGNKPLGIYPKDSSDPWLDAVTNHCPFSEEGGWQAKKGPKSQSKASWNKGQEEESPSTDI